jgi:hypothetical protein
MALARDDASLTIDARLVIHFALVATVNGFLARCQNRRVCLWTNTLQLATKIEPCRRLLGGVWGE